MQNQLPRPAFDPRQGKLGQQRDGIVIKLPPADGIKIAKQAAGIVIPAPPNIAGERPKPLLGRCDEAIEGASLADDGRDLGGSLDQHLHFIFAEDPGLDGLHHQNTLQDAAVDERHAKKGVVGVFAGFLEVFEAGMVSAFGDARTCSATRPASPSWIPIRRGHKISDGG